MTNTEMPVAEEAYLARIAEAYRSAREDPHVDMVLTSLDWVSLVILLLSLSPMVHLVLKSGKVRAGIMPGWLGLICLYTWLCFVAPMLAQSWAKDRRVWYHFPEGPALAGILFIGWFAAFIISAVLVTVRAICIGLFKMFKRNG